MNEREHEPATGIQAGAPSEVGGTIRSGAPDSTQPPSHEDATMAVGAPSAFDRWVETLKSQERWGLAGGVALQLAVLLSMMVMGTAKALQVWFR